MSEDPYPPEIQQRPYGKPWAKQTKKRRLAKTIAVLGAGGALFGIGVGVGSSNSDSATAAAQPQATVTETQTQYLPSPDYATVTATPTPTPQSSSQGLSTEISQDGTYVIGQDIPSGTWRTSGNGGSGDDCTFYVLKNSTNSDDSSNIIDLGSFNGPNTKDLSGAYAFEIHGGCTWSKQ